MASSEQTSPKPNETLYEEGGSPTMFLAGGVTLDEVLEGIGYWCRQTTAESGLLRLTPRWLKPRWTTEEERNDPDRLYELFGESEGIDTSVYYEQVGDEQEGAYLYLEVSDVTPDGLADGE